MKRIRMWSASLRRAARWEEAAPGDAEIARLKGLFASARAEDPEAAERIWWRLRHRLAGLGAAAPPSFLATLASAGPRFAVGALCTLALMAALYIAQPGTEPAPTAASSASGTDVTMLVTPERLVGEPFGTRDGGELLQFIAYVPAR